MIGYKKSILLTIPTITSYHTFLKELMQALVEAGWEAHLACSVKPIRGFDCYNETIFGKVHNIAFPRGANPIEHLHASVQLRSLVPRLSPDLIHCHFGVTAFTAALAHKRNWPPTIATIQGLTFPQSKGFQRALFSFCECISQRRLQGTWVLTQCDVDALKKLCVNDKIFLQHSKGFGCRLDLFDRARHSDNDLVLLRRSLGINDNDFVFIFVGRQVHFKGFALLIRAFLKIVADFREVKLLLVGERDPIHKTGLSVAEEQQIISCKNIIPIGWVSDVSKYLAIAHANVFPSFREGMPVNLMESLAIGVPVITSDSRGCRDVVRDNIDGFVLRQPTETSVESAMRRLYKDDALRLRFATNALAGRSRFDRNTWIHEQIRVYEHILFNGTGKRTEV